MKIPTHQKKYQDGAGLIEYLVVIAFIILAAVITLYFVGSSTSETIQEAGSAISGNTTAINANNNGSGNPVPTPETCGNGTCDPSDNPYCRDCPGACSDIDCGPCKKKLCPSVNGEDCAIDNNAGGCGDNEYCYGGGCVLNEPLRDPCESIYCDLCQTCESGTCKAVQDGAGCLFPCHSCLAGQCVANDAAGGCRPPLFCNSGQCVTP